MGRCTEYITVNLNIKLEYTTVNLNIKLETSLICEMKWKFTQTIKSTVMQS